MKIKTYKKDKTWSDFIFAFSKDDGKTWFNIDFLGNISRPTEIGMNSIKCESVEITVEEFVKNVKFDDNDITPKFDHYGYLGRALSYIPEKVVMVKLNESYQAIVSKDGIQVGCQKFPLSVITDLVNARIVVMPA